MRALPPEHIARVVLPKASVVRTLAGMRHITSTRCPQVRLGSRVCLGAQNCGAIAFDVRFTATMCAVHRRASPSSSATRTKTPSKVNPATLNLDVWRLAEEWAVLRYDQSENRGQCAATREASAYTSPRITARCEKTIDAIIPARPDEYVETARRNVSGGAVDVDSAVQWLAAQHLSACLDAAAIAELVEVAHGSAAVYPQLHALFLASTSERRVDGVRTEAIRTWAKTNDNAILARMCVLVNLLDAYRRWANQHAPADEVESDLLRALAQMRHARGGDTTRGVRRANVLSYRSCVCDTMNRLWTPLLSLGHSYWRALIAQPVRIGTHASQAPQKPQQRRQAQRAMKLSSTVEVFMSTLLEPVLSEANVPTTGRSAHTAAPADAAMSCGESLSGAFLFSVGTQLAEVLRTLPSPALRAAQGSPSPFPARRTNTQKSQRDDVMAALSLVEKYTAQCAGVLQQAGSAAGRRAEKDAARSVLVAYVALVLDLRYWLTAFDGLLPSVWCDGVESGTARVLERVFGAVEHDPDLFPALCERHLLVRVEALQQDGPRAHSRSLYALTSHALLGAARVFYVRHRARAKRFVNETWAADPYLGRVVPQSLGPFGSASLAPTAATTGDADVKERAAADLLHGVVPLCACLMAAGLAAETVVSSGLCVSLSVIEAIDLEHVYGLFHAPRTPGAQLAHTPAQTPSRLRTLIEQGTTQALEACDVAVRRMVVTPTQLMQERQRDGLGAHNLSTTGATADDARAFPPRLRPGIVRGGALLHEHNEGSGGGGVAGAHVQFSASGAIPYERVREQVECTLYIGLRALVQAVARGDKNAAMAVVVRLIALLNFYGAQDSFLLQVELLSLIRSGVAHALASFGQCRRDAQKETVRWQRVGWRAQAPHTVASLEEAETWCTYLRATTPAIEGALQVIVSFFMPRLLDTVARAERRPSTRSTSALSTSSSVSRRPPNRSQNSHSTALDNGVVDLADAVVVAQHLAALWHLTANLAVLGISPSAHRQLLALHRTLQTAQDTQPQSSDAPRLLLEIRAMQRMLARTRQWCLPVRRHDCSLALHASNAAIQSILATHLVSVMTTLAAPRRPHAMGTSGEAAAEARPSRSHEVATLDQRTVRAAVLIAATHLVATADAHFSVSVESQAMREVRVRWLGTSLGSIAHALSGWLDDDGECGDGEVSTDLEDALCAALPSLSASMSGTPDVIVRAGVALAMLCEVAAVTCTATTAHTLSPVLYSSLWRAVEGCAQRWRERVSPSEPPRTRCTHARTKLTGGGHPHQRLRQAHTAFLHAQLADIACIMAVVFRVPTDDGAMLQQRFLSGLERVVDLLDFDGVHAIVHTLFSTETPAVVATVVSTSPLRAQVARVLSNAIASSRHPRTTPGTVAESLAVIDALTACPTTAAERTASIIPAELEATYKHLVVHLTVMLEPQPVQGQDTPPLLNAELDLQSACTLLRLCTRQLQSALVMPTEVSAGSPSFLASQRLSLIVSHAVVRAVQTRLTTAPTAAIAGASAPMTVDELCAVVRAFAELSGDLQASRDAVLGAAIGPLLRVVPSLSPAQLVGVMESYARADVAHEALWMILMARLSALETRLSLTLSVRLVHLAIGAAPFTHTAPGVRTACRAAVYPIFEKQVHQLLQSDPHSLTNGSLIADDVLECLLACFATEAVSVAVLESLAAHPERLSVHTMKAALSLAAAAARPRHEDERGDRSRDGTGVGVSSHSARSGTVDALTQRCFDALMPSCGPHDLAALGRGLLACQVGGGAIIAAMRSRFSALVQAEREMEEQQRRASAAAARTASNRKTREGAKHVPGRGTRGAVSAAVCDSPSSPSLTPGWCIDGSALAALADVVVALGVGAEDAVLVELFTAEISRLTLPRHGASASGTCACVAPPPLTGKQICSLLRLCRTCCTGRLLPQVIPAVDGLLNCFESRWEASTTRDASAAFVEDITAWDYEVALSTCLILASTPKAHQGLVGRVAEALHTPLTGTAVGTHQRSAAWPSDLQLVAQLLSALAQLDVSEARRMPIVADLCGILYTQRRQLLRRPQTLQTTQHAMYLLGAEMHTQLYALVTV